MSPFKDFFMLGSEAGLDISLRLIII